METFGALPTPFDGQLQGRKACTSGMSPNMAAVTVEPCISGRKTEVTDGAGVGFFRRSDCGRGLGFGLGFCRWSLMGGGGVAEEGETLGEGAWWTA